MGLETKPKRIAHGMHGTRLYYIWNGMMMRCYNKNNARYETYGKEGVTVYAEWHKFIPFMNWSLSNGYAEDLTIDKDILCDKLNISPKIYSPETCQWVTATIQNRASRKICKSNTSGYRGVGINRQKNGWRARITVDLKEISLGSYTYPWTAAYAYDSYILKYNLEHTRNFKRRSYQTC